MEKYIYIHEDYYSISDSSKIDYVEKYKICYCRYAKDCVITNEIMEIVIDVPPKYSRTYKEQLIMRFFDDIGLELFTKQYNMLNDVRKLTLHKYSDFVPKNIDELYLETDIYYQISDVNVKQLFIGKLQCETIFDGNTKLPNNLECIQTTIYRLYTKYMELNFSQNIDCLKELKFSLENTLENKPDIIQLSETFIKKLTIGNCGELYIPKTLKYLECSYIDKIICNYPIKRLNRIECEYIKKFEGAPEKIDLVKTRTINPFFNNSIKIDKLELNTVDILYSKCNLEINRLEIIVNRRDFNIDIKNIELNLKKLNLCVSFSNISIEMADNNLTHLKVNADKILIIRLSESISGLYLIGDTISVLKYPQLTTLLVDNSEFFYVKNLPTSLTCLYLKNLYLPIPINKTLNIYYKNKNCVKIPDEIKCKRLLQIPSPSEVTDFD